MRSAYKQLQEYRPERNPNGSDGPLLVPMRIDLRNAIHWVIT